MNAQGSRKVKRHLLEDDYDGVLEVAREQVEGGAHVLDVCVALTERADEAEQMSKTVKLLSILPPPRGRRQLDEGVAEDPPGGHLREPPLGDCALGLVLVLLGEHEVPVQGLGQVRVRCGQVHQQAGELGKARPDPPELAGEGHAGPHAHGDDHDLGGDGPEPVAATDAAFGDLDSDGRIDLVLADYVLEHIDPEHAQGVADEITRVLKPGGWLAARTP